MKSELDKQSTQLTLMVEKYPDATYQNTANIGDFRYNLWVSNSTMCRALQRHRLTLKKRLYAAVKLGAKES